MQMTRTGHHYPKPEWAEWRNRTVDSIMEQWGRNSQVRTISEPMIMKVDYWAGDKRRRDVPGMIDAIFHCLERGEFVRDDSLITTVHWNFMGMDKKNPRAVVDIIIEGAI
jgi:Holliday junction resolvase RusA-like endonuclease